MSAKKHSNDNKTKTSRLSGDARAAGRVSRGRPVTEFAQVHTHHIVSTSVGNHEKAAKLAYSHGAALVTGTKKHFVAHFSDKDKSTAFHRAMRATGHLSAKHATVRESIPATKTDAV